MDDRALAVLNFVVAPALQASKRKLEAKGYSADYTNSCGQGLARVGLVIRRTPETSVAVSYYWKEQENVFEQSISPSGVGSQDLCEPFPTLTPAIVKRGVALGVEVLHKALASV